MNTTRMNLIAAAAAGVLAAALGGPAWSADTAQRNADRQAKADYKASVKKADDEYKSAMNSCKSMSGDPKKTCEKEAKADQKKAKADAKAQRDSREAKNDAAHEKREANASVAKERAKSGETGGVGATTGPGSTNATAPSSTKR